MAISEVTLNTTFDGWKTITNTIAEHLGDVDSLSTTAKSNLVEALNEVHNEIGDRSSLSTAEKSNLVGAINEVIQSIGDVSTIDSGLTATDPIDAINTLATRLGDLSALSTTAKNTVIVAINELHSDAETLAQEVSNISNDLDTAEQNITDLDNNIGDLSTLNTSEKSSLVGSVNEVLSSIISQNNIQYTNLIENRGRFASDVTKVSASFNSVSAYLNPANTSTFAEGDRFFDDNSSNGGAGSTLGVDMVALMAAMTTRSNKRYGFEFFINEITAGGGTANTQTYNVNNYYPILTNGDIYLGAIGDVVTFKCWIRLKSCADEATYSGLLVGGTDVTTYIDGVEQSNQSILAVSDGWVHLAQTVTLTSEYFDFIPAIAANVGDVVEIAIPALFNANNTSIHTGVI